MLVGSLRFIAGKLPWTFGQRRGNTLNTEPCLVSQLFRLTKDGAEYLDDPSLSTVFQALSTLDGIDTDTASITLHNGDSMDVGGGDGRYVCHARTNKRFLHLVNVNCELDATDLVTIMMSEEATTYPRSYIVPFEIVKVAVECFCSTGALSTELPWDDTLRFDPL